MAATSKKIRRTMDKKEILELWQDQQHSAELLLNLRELGILEKCVRW